MLNYLSGVHVLQHFIAVQGDSKSTVQICRAGFKIMAPVGDFSVANLTHVVGLAGIVVKAWGLI